MQRSLFCATLIAGSLSLLPAAGALAADLPVKAEPPPVSWNGFYVGGIGGYGWSKDGVAFAPGPFYLPSFAAGDAPFLTANSPAGPLVGVTWGSDWQFGRFVGGFVSDFSGADISDSALYTGALGGFGNVYQRTSWFGTTRVRAGFLAWDNVLFYATGGLADAYAQSSASLNLAACPAAGACLSGSAGQTLWGWTAGAGTELITGNWSAKLEYLHYDLGSLSYGVFDPRTPLFTVAASNKFAGDMVRAGLTYRFVNWWPMQALLGH